VGLSLEEGVKVGWGKGNYGFKEEGYLGNLISPQITSGSHAFDGLMEDSLC